MPQACSRSPVEGATDQTLGKMRVAAWLDTARVRLLAGIAVLVVVAGCGSGKSDSLPGACTEGPAAITNALTKAPSVVTMQGTPISRCFTRDASGDDMQIVGGFLLAVAQQLGDRARSGDQQAALQLGYLIGSARRGVNRSGQGTEIVRRLEAETSDLGNSRAAYQRGLRAGRAQG
jgi:hypothetical protein